MEEYVDVYLCSFSSASTKKPRTAQTHVFIRIEPCDVGVALPVALLVELREHSVVAWRTDIQFHQYVSQYHWCR